MSVEVFPQLVDRLRVQKKEKKKVSNVAIMCLRDAGPCTRQVQAEFTSTFPPTKVSCNRFNRARGEEMGEGRKQEREEAYG